MTSRARLLLGFAAAAVLAAIALPLWEVRLGAPQYPEGLGLQILSHTVRGIQPHDLQNINGLNHYIGMKVIEPDSIPELRYIPWILAAMAAALALVAWRGARRALAVWLVAFALLGAVGIWDFWRWEYDYGHNLDTESAAIVVPGMTYQPPLIGTKQLLNFTATAWPGTGTIVLGLAWLTGLAVLVASRRRERGGVTATRAAAALVMAGCAVGPPSIALDLDECHFCRMTISDARYAAAAITAAGRTVRFDSIECLVGWTLEESRPPHRAWVSDHGRPGVLVDVHAAAFRRGPAGSSPMGRGWQAVPASAATDGLRDWDGLLAAVAAEGALPPVPGLPPAAAGATRS